MDSLEKTLQILLIFGLSLGQLAVDINSSPGDKEASSELNQPSIQMIHENNNISSNDHTSKNAHDSITEQSDQNKGIFDGIHKTEFEITKNETARNPAYTSENFDSIKYIDGGLDFINETIEDNSTLIDYPQSIDFLTYPAFTTSMPLNASQFPYVSTYNVSSYDNTTINETSRNPIYTPENFDSVFKYIDDGLDFFNETKGENSGLFDNQQSFDYLSSSVTTSPVLLNTSSEFQDVSMHNQSNHNNTITTTVNKTSQNPDYTFKTEFVTQSNVITFEKKPEPTQPVILENTADIIPNVEEYAVILPRICTNNSIINRLLHFLNVSPNITRPANFTCKSINDMKITINSKKLFDKINEFLKAEAKTDDLIFIKVTPNSTLSFEVLPQSSFHGVFIPMFVVAIVGNVLFWIIIIIICICLYKKVCKRRSTSLDLNRIPHLNLKADYNLTPIPRPSISYPDNHRDFLHAYAQDNYKRQRQENIFNKPNNSHTVAKIYDEVDKEICPKKELSTFTMSTDRKSEFKASTSQNYASSQAWTGLQEMNSVKKHGIENAAYKKW